MNRTRTAVTASVLALLACAGSAFAGPLNPPAGAVGASMKTLSEVEPRTAVNAVNTPGNAQSVFRITQPGSYYLTANIAVPSGMSGVVIGASGVKLDLNGFSITGLPGSVDGVATSSTLTPYKHIRVSNGTINSMGGSGVYLVSFTPGESQQHAVDRVDVNACGNVGVQVTDGRITDCRAQNCGSTGIYAFASFDTTVDRCSASGCGGSGIRVVQGTVSNSAASDNPAGINVDNGCITACTVRSNTTGIVLGFGTVSGCNCEGSTSIGIDLGGNSTARNNTIGGAGGAAVGTVGIRSSLSSGARIEGNNILRVGTGVLAITSNNLIVGNSFRGCLTVMNSTAGNRVGTLVTATSSAAINGATGGGLGTADPLANIIY